MKQEQRYFYFKSVIKQGLALGCACAMLISYSSCEKNENAGPIVDTLLFGLWRNELALNTEYDNQNNVVDVDTVIFSNAIGDPVIYYEKYSRPSEILMLGDLTDTIGEIMTFHKTGNNLIIDLPDSTLYFFNNRTITILNDSIFSAYQTYSLNPKKVWSQTFSRQ